MKIHLLDPKDESGLLILSMPVIDMYVEFDAEGNASICTKTDEQLLACTQVVFESEISGRIENAVALASEISEADRIFKGQLLIMKALIEDKVSENEI